MDRSYSKIKYGLVVFGILCLAYNLWEFFTAKHSTKQGVTFVAECLLGIGLIFLPDLANKFLKIIMPPTIAYSYQFFLFVSVLLGTSLYMTSAISFWNKILHFISPMLLTAVGYGVVGFLLKKTKYVDASPQLFLLFGFAFAGSCSILQEFWEFICDSLGDMNLQRYNISNDQPFIGRAALVNTMGDLLTNTLRASMMSVYTYIRSKGNPEYLGNYAIKRK